MSPTAKLIIAQSLCVLLAFQAFTTSRSRRHDQFPNEQRHVDGRTNSIKEVYCQTEPTTENRTFIREGTQWAQPAWVVAVWLTDAAPVRSLPEGRNFS